MARGSTGRVCFRRWPGVLRRLPRRRRRFCRISPPTQVRARFTGPNSATASSDPITAVLDRNADGTASEDIGPGSVNLLTGDYTLSDTDTDTDTDTDADVSFFGMSVSRTASSQSPQAAG
ncbi:MAG: hypothetical protein HOV83_41180 [Catenulispora sp.]|nr:hypothetical protein [Catenulispora sp.]